MAQPRYTRRKTSRTIFWSRIVAGLVVLFPLSLSQMDFRSGFAHPISVAAYKSSPAYAAFEDLRENYPDDSFEIPERAAVLLTSGQRFDYRAVENMPRIRQLALRGMTIRAPAAIEPRAPMMVATAASDSVVRQLSTLTPMRAAAPLAPRQMYMDDSPTSGYSITSVSARAQELVQRELMANPPADEDRKIIQSSTGTRIIIARNDSPVPTASPTPTGSGRTADPYIPPSPRVNPPPIEPASTDYGFMSGVNPDPENQRPMWLNGAIEMTGGLAFVGPETQIVVKRVYNGMTLEKGRIWITEGKFEIHVKRAIGYLVAELYTSNGRVLGRGEIDLLNLQSAVTNENRISDLRIALHPTSDAASLRAVSAYSHDQNIISVPGARVEIQAHTDPQPVNDDGVMTDPTLAKDSTYVARATAKKNWSSLVVGQASRPQDIRLFSNSLIEALINLQLNGTDRAEAFHRGIVWGQINRNGHPIAGATVEMAGDYQPIYFDEAYLPDRRLTATGKNGLFAYLKVSAGVQAVRVRDSGRVYPAQVFPTEDKHVSYLEFELRDKVISQFKVIDVLDMNKPVSARIRLVGLDATLATSGDEYVEYGVAANTFMIEAEAGPEFEVSRTTLNGAPHMVHIPLVKRDWLTGLAVGRQFPVMPGRGHIVGFIDNQDYEVELTGYGAQEQMQIVYFDASGKPLEGRTGVAGGGFAIFNAPPGLQTVYIHPVQSRDSYSQVVVAESSYVHVLTWSAAGPR